MYYYIKFISKDVFFAYNKDLAFWFATENKDMVTLISSKFVADEQLRMIARELNLIEAHLCVEIFNEDED